MKKSRKLINQPTSAVIFLLKVLAKISHSLPFNYLSGMW